MTLEELYTIIESRKKNMPSDSYAASLFRDGEDRIIQKIGEEATEVVIAAKNNSKDRQISEISDLLFHLLILMVQQNLTLPMIYSQLAKRDKISRNEKKDKVQ
jgi:phosphoribosyl-ATP pyrophosphohydrolase